MWWWSMTEALTWQPGDPLHTHPWYRPESTQTVRALFDVHDDAGHVWEWFQRGMAHCDRCEVAWRAWSPGAEVALTCWMCGGEGQPPTEA